MSNFYVISLFIGFIQFSYVCAIVGGIETKIEYFPYELNLCEDTLFNCHATIISEYYAITAANCVNGGSLPSNITLFGGSSDRFEGTKFTADYYRLHPKYNRSNHDYNIAVIRVTERFSGSNINPIKLIDSNVDIIAGKRAVVAGWGYYGPAFPVLLQETDVPIIEQGICSQSLAMTDRIFCAGQIGRDACLLDSGAPIVSEGVLIGLVSFRTSICANQLPGTYVRLSNEEIRQFIKDETGV